MGPDINPLVDLVGIAYHVQAECSANFAKLDRCLAGLANYSSVVSGRALRADGPAPEMRPASASALLAAALASAAYVKAAAAASLAAADQLRAQAAAAWATANEPPPRKNSRWDAAEPRTPATRAAQGTVDRATALAWVTIDPTGIDGELRPLATPLGQSTGGGLAPPLLPVGPAGAGLSSSRGLLATEPAVGVDAGSGAACKGRGGRRNRPQDALAAASGGDMSR